MWSSDSDLEMLDMLSDWSGISSDMDSTNTIGQFGDTHCTSNSNNEVLGNMSMYCDEEDASSFQDTQSKGDATFFDSLRCNVCNEAISDFRYTCVQCSDFDLCAACEGSRAHHQHYVLRVPGQRPATEVQFVLATIRRHLMKKLDPITAPDTNDDDNISVKTEIKVEVEEECDISNAEDNSDDEDNDEHSDVESNDAGNNDSDEQSDDNEADDELDPRSTTGDTSDRPETIPSNENEAQNTMGIVKTSIKTEQNVIESNDSDKDQHAESTDTMAVPTTAKRIIVIKRSDIINVQDGSPSAKKLCVVPLSNSPRGMEESLIRVTSHNPEEPLYDPETGQE